MRALLKRYEIRVRTRMPRAVRQLYRISRVLSEAAPVAKPLPPELVSDCKVVSSRFELLDILPKGGKVVEVGTAAGGFAREILRRNAPLELHVVDIDYSKFDRTLLNDPRLKRHEGLSAEVISTFPDAYFDWVYIDADHSYTGVLLDAHTAAPKLKPGGLMVFNDFAHLDPELGRYGVQRAVVDFALKMGWPLRYFALEPSALYDVALKKP